MTNPAENREKSVTGHGCSNSFGNAGVAPANASYARCPDGVSHNRAYYHFHSCQRLLDMGYRPILYNILNP